MRHLGLSASKPLGRGEVRYLGYRPELGADIFAIRPRDGSPPFPLRDFIARAPEVERLGRELVEAILLCEYHELSPSAYNEDLQGLARRLRAVLEEQKEG